jgi:hypothetical protein
MEPSPVEFPSSKVQRHYERTESTKQYSYKYEKTSNTLVHRQYYEKIPPELLPQFVKTMCS